MILWVVLHCVSAIPLQPLRIDARRVVVAGCSHAADFSHQFHVAFSGTVTGACIFSGQPYTCAVTRFAHDALVRQTPQSSVPRCAACPANKTLAYDHCKNHPQWVDVNALPAPPAGSQQPCAGGCDPAANPMNASVFLFRPTHDRCYLPGAVENVAAWYGKHLADPAATVRFVNDQPFPHCLPTNSTPFYNTTVPSMYDGPGECLRWTVPGLRTAKPMDRRNLYVFDQREFIASLRLNGTGVAPYGAVYIPEACSTGGSAPSCPLLILPNGCKGAGDDAGALFSGSDDAFAAYAEGSDMVVLKPCVGGFVDAERFPNSAEVQRGLLDVYGQLSDDYATQTAPHMSFVGAAVKRLMGL